MTLARPLLLAVLALAASPAAAAAPRDELLRAAPPDAALLVLVQNARDHIHDLERSPFAQWFPQSAIGKQLFAGHDLKQAWEAAAPILAALGIKPEELLAEIFGDAAAFAYTPAPSDDPKGERAVVLIRPRKLEMLAGLVAKLNELQTASGEVKAVVSRRHRGEEYFERQKPAGSDFYCFCGGVFAFSGTEPDIQAVIDRDKGAAQKPALAAKIAQLGVGNAFVVALIGPRHFDAELKAKLAKAAGHEKLLLTRFQEVWRALDSAALYFALGADLEAGVALQFAPDKAPPVAKHWLTGPRTNPALWQAIPENALVALAGRFKPIELIEIGSLAPGDGPNPLQSAVEQFLGPIFGKNKLPHVLAALGPQWALWAEPPAAGSGFLPTVVAAVQIDTSGSNGKEASREIARAVGFGFNALRVAYNSSHADQIELVETEDGGAVITSLVNEKGFPPGVRPAYAFKGGFLLAATSPDAIQRFQEPKANPAARPEATLARFSAVSTRNYLRAHRDQLTKFLASSGHGDEKDLLQQFQQAASVLELVDRIELVTRGDETGMRLAAKIIFAKPLKK
jgi:hypothetical protein